MFVLSNREFNLINKTKFNIINSLFDLILDDEEPIHTIEREEEFDFKKFIMR